MLVDNDNDNDNEDSEEMGSKGETNQPTTPLQC